MAGGNKALWFDAPGSAFRLGEADVPTPGADQILIQNHAVAINPVDWKINAFAQMIQQWPIVLGCDAAGTVSAVGADVTKFKKGDRVIGHAASLGTGKAQDGAFAHFTTVQAARAAILPESLSFVQGVVLPLAFDTAAAGLFRSVEDGYLGLGKPSLDPSPSGKTIVIWGGSSSVGTLATQLSTASGAKTVVTASPHNHAFCKSMGATEVLDYNSSSIVDDVVSAVKKVGGDFAGIYDAIATTDTFQHDIGIIQKLGRGNVAVVLPGPSDGPKDVRFTYVYGIDTSTFPLWESYVTPALEQGKLKCVPKPSVVGKGLESVQKGIDMNEKGVSATKLVIEL